MGLGDHGRARGSWLRCAASDQGVDGSRTWPSRRPGRRRQSCSQPRQQKIRWWRRWPPRRPTGGWPGSRSGRS